MDQNTPETVTVLLAQAREGDADATEKLYDLVQHQLRRIAKNQLRGERPDHSLEPTIIIDDVFLRLVGERGNIDWKNRQQFYRTAAKAMRRVLIDHERRRRAQRRGGGNHRRVSIDPDLLGVEETCSDLLALDEALTRLAEFDPRQSEVVELHHFGGCTLKETAEMIGVPLGAVKADWRTAKAWLHRELTRGGDEHTT